MHNELLIKVYRWTGQYHTMTQACCGACMHAYRSSMLVADWKHHHHHYNIYHLNAWLICLSLSVYVQKVHTCLIILFWPLDCRLLHTVFEIRVTELMSYLLFVVRARQWAFLTKKTTTMIIPATRNKITAPPTPTPTAMASVLSGSSLTTTPVEPGLGELVVESSGLEVVVGSSILGGVGRTVVIKCISQSNNLRHSNFSFTFTGQSTINLLTECIAVRSIESFSTDYTHSS